MATCGMLLDTTHIADRSFWEALDHYSGPILASHQNCRFSTMETNGCFDNFSFYMLNKSMNSILIY